MEGLRKKLELTEDILEFSKRQSRLLKVKGEMDADALMAVTDEKQHMIDRLSELDKELESSGANGEAGDMRLQKKIDDTLKKITQIDADNIEVLRSKMDDVKKDIKENKEKIKVNEAYKPILGSEKDGSKLNVKDDRK